MHWQAIRRSTHPQDVSAAAPTTIQLDGNDSRPRGDVAPMETPAFATGDNACDFDRRPWTQPDRCISELVALAHGAASYDDAKLALDSLEIQQSLLESRPLGGAYGSQPISTTSSCWSRLTEENVRALDSTFAAGRLNELIAPSSIATLDDEHTISTHTVLPFLQVQIPFTPSNNLAPFAYQRALRNRIRDDELGPGQKYDLKAYTPLFIYDGLMLPGSLANIRGKGSAEDIIRRMTPALLPAFHAHVHSTTHAPVILPSSAPGAHVPGMLILGQSRAVRRRVHAHYRDTCKRVKAEVELDTLHAVPARLRADPRARWQLRRRSLWAHVWIWRDGAGGAETTVASRRGEGAWRLDDYLAGEYEGVRSLRVEPAGWLEDEREGVATARSEDDGSSADGWDAAQTEHLGEWEEGSDGGGAVLWDEKAWGKIPQSEGEGEDDYVDRGHLNRDYDRGGSAGWW